ncbi:hypothetical protein SLEP1_g10782 [Rubroshorea leprosula]|uniref:Sacsin/Nov domain-containing protein n=3 Tax=Rubroshorea leprosula TaxID=152421 RepID=A0AAV5IIL8_9ROSI|nr:hypothetical protein SLEP1_g10782 [Rubroshorea leprosula]
MLCGDEYNFLFHAATRYAQAVPMQGYPYGFRLPGGGETSQPPLQHPTQNYSFAFQNADMYQVLHAAQAQVTQQTLPYLPFQNPNYPQQNHNFRPQIPNFPRQHGYGNQSFGHPPFHRESVGCEKPMGVLERVDRAVAKARRDLIAAGESVSAWKVSQSALQILQVDSWHSLGCQMLEVPSLRQLMLTEERINAFIHCFLGVRTITTLYDLEMAICKNESIKKFEELELGPYLRHPLILQYFLPSFDVSMVVKITCEDVIACLCEFMKTHKKKRIQVGDFLEFVAMKHSVMGKEKLGVRIQNLGMYISFIREAKRSEDAIINKCQGGLKLKERYVTMTERVESFYSVHKDFCGKHIKFDLSSSEEEDANDHGHRDENNDNDVGSHFKLSVDKLSSDIVNISDRPSSCPYPSATEELTRLGLRDGVNKSTPASGKSRQIENIRSSITKRRGKFEKGKFEKRKFEKRKFEKRKFEKRKFEKRKFEEDRSKKNVLPYDDSYEWNEFILLDEVDISLSNHSVNTFITTWKEACKELTIIKVLQRMFHFYKPKFRKKRRIMKSMLSSYPFLGLLIVAVTAIKKGMWDSTYDAIQAINQPEFTNTSDNYTEYESIEVEPSEKDKSSVSKHSMQSTQHVTPEEVSRKVTAFFQHNHEILKGMTKEKKFILLRKLCDCGSWLADQFSVKEFRYLGFGDFFTFLENNFSLLPKEMKELFAGGSCDTSSLEVCILQLLLVVLVSQASQNLRENEIINKEMISTLLTRQFPCISFKIMENGPMENFLEKLEKYKNDVISKCVLFSASMLGMCHVDNSLAHGENYLLESLEGGNNLLQKDRTVKSMTSKDALDVLLRAPMLSDLISWSHWDVVFAPSLGPLVVWLLNEVNAKELLCLVTKDGKVVRIDHLATLDSFLQAALKGSSFETAVELLSLFSLSGGVKHLPLSLLRCYAHQAIDVMMKNQLENMEVTDGLNGHMIGKTLFVQQMTDNCFADRLDGELQINSTRINEVVSFVSQFVLDCLGYLPAEFREFAADIFLDGLRTIVKDGPSTILRECRNLEQRFMLHEIGLSLGIVQWIEDYNAFFSAKTIDLFLPLNCKASEVDSGTAESRFGSSSKQNAVNKLSSSGITTISVSDGIDEQPGESPQVHSKLNDAKVSSAGVADGGKEKSCLINEEKDAALIVESIRRDEFGIDPNLSGIESSMLKKQHARLGRALHCLSQELYSQDSHFLLELVQNADDNIYSKNVEPTLTFILQESGVVVLNNEDGFSAQNIRALCDIGNSTKKECSGYIGKKGIGFKSVFRVTDAPEIHSNGFHVKFDISEGQIGFVLPTLISPCDVNHFRSLLSGGTDHLDHECWNTCIVLPFRSRMSKGVDMNNIVSMFSDLHPSLLLFLHRLKCIVFRNMLNCTLTAMRKEILGNGIIKVSCADDKMTWFVESKKLDAKVVYRDVRVTEIAMAFTLQELENGFYGAVLDQQPVFAFLPLRTYGLKFILQGDFVLPSSREEVDGDSPWNQWLLSQFPGLFIGAERSFCALPCFRENPGKAVTVYMSFVPLIGEVNGFFSCLPRMIISGLRMSNCLLLEGNKNQWVPPCKVLRGWNEHAHNLFPDDLLHDHLGLGFLDRDIVLSDSLARALGIEEYGPKVLVQMISSLCGKENCLKSMGLHWLSSWLNEFCMMSFHSLGQDSVKSGIEADLIDNLRKIPFIPLSDGTFSSLEKGTIWLHFDVISAGFDGGSGLEAFPCLSAKLRLVTPALLSASSVPNSCMDMTLVGNITRVLHSIGVQQLTAHDIIKVHILPAMAEMMGGDKDLMIDYLCFVMVHLQTGCPSCLVERDSIISELQSNAFILTNHGFKRPIEASVHFSYEFDSPVNINKFVNDMETKWHEVDNTYLNHPAAKSQVRKWREFFQEIGVTDFVQVIQVDKSFADMSDTILEQMLSDRKLISHGSVAKDWESRELVELLSLLSTSSNQEGCKYLLEVLDKLWDDYFCEKVTGYFNFKSDGDIKPFKSSFLCNICDVQWMVSSMDDKLHYPRDLFHDCDAVRYILGDSAPYAVPKVRSGKLVKDIGFKTLVTTDDIHKVLKLWRSQAPFKASIAQMSRFYSFIWNEMSTSRQKIAAEFYSGPSIFVPYKSGSRLDDVISGAFLCSKEVYWHDPTSCMNQIESQSNCDSVQNHRPLNRTLCNVYPGLHDFFVNECGVSKEPSFSSYLDILLELSTAVLPSQAANAVFQVFMKWADDLKSGVLSSEDVIQIKECLSKLEYKVLPTLLDKWVSLHPSFGLVCWCDDEQLRKRFKHLDAVDFLYFGNLKNEEQEFLQSKVSVLMRTIGIPILSEIVTREAVYDGQSDSIFKASLVNWALPFMQRYLYCVHPDKYLQLKQSGFDNINNLQIVVVDKLYYRNVIKRFGIISNKRIKCSCLLQV